MFPYLTVLIALAAIVAALAIYRRVVARNEDDFVHLADSTGHLIQNQQKLASSLKLIDRVGMTLTVATAVYGVGLLVWYLYTALTTRNVF
jgi:hypothetical protein